MKNSKTNQEDIKEINNKLQELIEKISKQYSDKSKEKDEKTSARKIAKDQENFARTNFTKSSLNIENYQKQIDEENESKNIITNEFTEKGKLDLILNIDEGIEKEEKLQNECKEKVEKSNPINNITVFIFYNFIDTLLTICLHKTLSRKRI